MLSLLPLVSSGCGGRSSLDLGSVAVGAPETGGSSTGGTGGNPSGGSGAFGSGGAHSGGSSGGTSVGGAQSFCGDGVVQGNEACDDGNLGNDDACTVLCEPPECGDGFRNALETCDDGNHDNYDDCTLFCEPPGCGDGFQQSGEECDDANLSDFDSCSSECKLSMCGDGFVQPGEVCEDGNETTGDGCGQCQQVVQIVTGRTHTCSLDSAGRVKCWGDNWQGQLGLGDNQDRGEQDGEMGDSLPYVDLGTDRRALLLAAGAGHTCALLDDQSLKCWGYNYGGQLGLGDTLNRGDDPGEMGDDLPAIELGSGRHAVEVVAGGGHTCALLDDGALKCWGENYSGQLGGQEFGSRGGLPGEMGDALPSVDLGSDRTIAGIAAGDWHTCARFDDGAAKCWGENFYGQLGLGDAFDRGLAPTEMGDALPPLDLGTGRSVTALTAGSKHTCALLDDASLKCWGANVAGSLGLGDTNVRGREPGDMGDALPSVDLGAGRSVVKVLAGLVHTCAVLDDASLKCWGYNSMGQLGLGDAEPRGDAPNEMGDNLPAVNLGTERSVVAPALGSDHTCALLDDTTVKCWGMNARGQLGAGDVLRVGEAPEQLGDNLSTVLVP